MSSSLRIFVAATLLALAASVSAAASTVQVTVGTSPAGPAFTVDGTQYTSAQTLTWTVGTSHTLSVSSPQIDSTTEYTFSSWSDSGAVSHTVTASSTTTSYTASFTTSYELTIATNNTHGTVTPTSGSYYAAGSQVAIVATPAGGYSFQDWTGSTDIASTTKSSTTITINGPESITANFKRSSGGIQYIAIVFSVTTTADDPVGISANCPLGGPANGAGLNCSLRDALEAASESGSGNIFFDATVFASTNTAAQNTITLSNGALRIPSNTIVSAPTVKNGNTLANLVTVSGNHQSSVFWIAPGVNFAEIDNLNIIDGANTFGGAGIYTGGRLTVTGSTISGNSAADGEGGGIYVDAGGILTLKFSTVSGNSAGSGGGIIDYGELDLDESTLSGNQASVRGGGLCAAGEAVLSASTITANKAVSNGVGGGIAVDIDKTLKLSNSIVAGNSSPTSDPDITGDYVDAGGNVISVPANLAALGNYGGPTQTHIPLPWSPAICAGLDSNVSAIVDSDQRGLPNVNMTYPGYSAASPCVDAGAVQTNYSLNFNGQPAPVAPESAILMNTAFSAAVTLNENGNPFSVPVLIPLSLTGTGSLTGGSATTSNGVATYPSLQIASAGTGDVLTASLTLNPPLSPAPFQVATSSNAFDVTSLATSTAASAAAAPFSSTAQSIVLTANVSSSSEPVNAGTVTFTVMSGAAVIGSPITSATVNDGSASANYILPANTAPGAYTIQAAYNAGGGFTASADATHTLTIAQAASSTALTSSIGNANLNAGITFTAMVTGTATIVPTGSVAFMDGAQALGGAALNAQGAATYTTSSLVAGTHAITAVYSGDADFAASTSAPYAQVVTAPNFTLSTTPASLSIASGQSGTVKFTMTSTGGFTGTVAFACSAPPAHAACSFSPASLTADGSNSAQSSTLTISTSGSSASGMSAPAGEGSSASGFASPFLLLPCVAFGLLFAAQRKKLRRSTRWLALALAAVALSAFAGCGGSSSKTAPGSYTMIVTASPGSGASSGVSQQTVSFTLTVTQ